MQLFQISESPHPRRRGVTINSMSRIEQAVSTAHPTS